jgi:hypothetical protein
VEGRGSITKSLHTCRRLGLGSGWPVAAARREQAEAVEGNGGGGAPVVVSSEEGVGKLHGGAGKLDVGSIGVEKGRERVLHGEQGARRAAVAGRGAPAEIRWRLGAGEHEQELGKLARGSVGAMGGRRRLPTTVSGSPDGRNGRRW